MVSGSGSDSDSGQWPIRQCSFFFFFHPSPFCFAFNHATYSPEEGCQIELEDYIIFEQCVSDS